jgi:hypothetical protein
MQAWSVRPKDIPIDETSASIWPFEEMWEADGAAKPNEERREIVEDFLHEVVAGKSLAFFYVDERNPLLADEADHSPARVLVGISRISRIGDISEWEEAVGGEFNMVWSVPFQHAYPKDGVRLPVQAILSAVPNADERAQYVVHLDSGIRTDFRYVSSRIALDRCVVVVERAIAALARVEADNIIKQSVAGELAWLNTSLLELWEDRGPYPGLASVLHDLGCARAVEIQQRGLADLVAAGEDIAEVAFAALDGDIHPQLEEFSDDLDEAADEWGYMSDAERDLARLLARMELSPAQVAGVLRSSERVKHRLPEDHTAILDNPYVLCEAFVPSRFEDPVSFVTVDHALLPHESMSAPVERVPRRDPRRLRALLVDVLRDAAADGHTFLPADLALEQAAERSPEDRRCDVPVDRLEHEKVAPVLAPVIERFTVGDSPFLALREIRAHEAVIEDFVSEMLSRPILDAPEVKWQTVAEELAAAGAERVTLSEEQEAALDRCLRSPLSVLTGAAGTGKSTLLAPLVRAISQIDGQVPIRALTPTGKAADRLAGLGVPAMTIHRALAGADWFDWGLGCFKQDSAGRVEADTVIVDEASMVDVELLGTLVRALDAHAVRRVVLVGDHHQLPPIGPGRPFYDLIALMDAADREGSESPFAGRLSELRHNYRVQEGSRAIAFASGFAREPVPDEPLLWSSLAKGQDEGDLRIRYWQDSDELYRLLLDEIDAVAARACEEAGLELDAERGFDASIGHEEGITPSHWQLLAPMRGWPHGTRKLNAVIQDRFHAWAKRSTANWYGVKFGDEQVTWHDKVIQIRNEQLRAYSHELNERERLAVFNGQIGRVVWTWPRPMKHGRSEKESGAPKRLHVAFEGQAGWVFEYGKNGRYSVPNNLELAYAITVHKSQGSQFRHVFFVVPQAAADVFGRELTYTGLTRAQDTLTLFVEKDLSALLGLRKRAAALTPRRNSRLFETALGVNAGYRASGRVHVTAAGEFVRSKSEVIIANLLEKYKQEGRLSYAYEEELAAPGSGGRDLRLPDFTVRVGGETFYWEHCGMVDDQSYIERWETVRRPWYKRHGFEHQLIETRDGTGGTINSEAIEREVILGRLLSRPA